MREIAALFVRKNSIYKTFDGVECYDAQRDARSWQGGTPIVAHPPCAQWGKLRYFAHDKPEEKALAPHAVELLRANGGVLEHPFGSLLWPHLRLPLQGRGVDAFGGFTMDVDQFWFGHRAQKRTLLYIVGVDRRTIELPPFKMGRADVTIASSRKRQTQHTCIQTSKAEREHTPEPFARWLVSIARSVSAAQ